MSERIALELAGIGALGIACQWLGWQLRLPAIVFLLLAGIAAGPATGLLRPDALFGELLFPLVTLSVAVILFEGSLTLRLADIRGVERVVLRMVTVGTLVSWVVVTVATQALVGASWEVATLFGAVMVVTGPTVIEPMLRTVRPTAAVGHVLRWEGILIDPIGALLAILTYQFVSVLGTGTALAATMLTLAKMVIAGVVIGAAAGYAVGQVLRRGLLPQFLHNFTVLGLVFVVFVLSNQVEHETGLLAVTVMGIALANMPDVHTEDILDFKASLSIFLISGLFILLAARLDVALLARVGWGALGVFIVVQFVARPLKVFVATLGSRLKWRERLLLAWIGPRGIVAAAISALFGLRLTQAGFPQADLLVPLAFMVIIGTVLLQGATAGWLARALGIAEPEPRGYLIVGANRVARAIALTLNRASYRTLLADTSWSDVTAARRAGLDVYYGNPVSGHADRHLDLLGLGGLLALSPQGELNSLAIMRFRREFGDGHVFGLHAEGEDDVPENLRVAALHPGHVLFGAKANHALLDRLLAAGHGLVTIELPEGEDPAARLARYGETALPLFALDPRGRLSVYTEAAQPQPTKGWQVIVLVPPEDFDAARGERRGADEAEVST